MVYWLFLISVVKGSNGCWMIQDNWRKLFVAYNYRNINCNFLFKYFLLQPGVRPVPWMKRVSSRLSKMWKRWILLIFKDDICHRRREKLFPSPHATSTILRYSSSRLFLRFGGMMPLFLYFINFTVQTVHSFSTFIRRHSPRFLFFSSSLVISVGKPSVGCRAENLTWACLTTSRRTTYGATRQRNWHFIVEQEIFIFVP